MSRVRQAAQRTSRGQAAVEFAMAVTVFLMLVFGTLDFGRAIYAYSFCSYAARDASRYAAVNGANSTQPATASDVTTFVDNEAVGLSQSDLTVNTTWNPNNNAGSVVQVQVEYAFHPVSWFFPSTTLTLSSTSQMVVW